MFTLSHPLAPTVTYAKSLPEAMTHYALVHLHEYDIEFHETDDGMGVSMAVSCLKTGAHCGLVSVM